MENQNELKLNTEQIMNKIKAITLITILALTGLAQATNYSLDLENAGGTAFGANCYNIQGGPIALKNGDTVQISYTISNGDDATAGLIFTDRIALSGVHPLHRIPTMPSLWAMFLKGTSEVVGASTTTITGTYVVTDVFGNSPALAEMYSKTTPQNVTIQIN